MSVQELNFHAVAQRLATAAMSEPAPDLWSRIERAHLSRRHRRRRLRLAGARGVTAPLPDGARPLVRITLRVHLENLQRFLFLALGHERAARLVDLQRAGRGMVDRLLESLRGLLVVAVESLQLREGRQGREVFFAANVGIRDGSPGPLLRFGQVDLGLSAEGRRLLPALPL